MQDTRSPGQVTADDVPGSSGGSKYVAKRHVRGDGTLQCKGAWNTKKAHGIYRRG